MWPRKHQTVNRKNTLHLADDYALLLETIDNRAGVFLVVGFVTRGDQDVIDVCNYVVQVA